MTAAAARIVHLPSVASTQTAAWVLADEGAPDRTVVVADTQTDGRGRRGRVWHDEPGASLLASVLLRPRLPIAMLPTLSLAAAVAVAGALERTAGLAPRLKWPNDVLVGGRKIAGLLLETRLPPSIGRPEPPAPWAGHPRSEPASRTPRHQSTRSPLQQSGLTAPATTDHAAPVTTVLGIGVNLRQTRFPDALAGRATSVVLESGSAPERDALLDVLLDELDRWRARLEREGFAGVRDRWRQLADTLGRRVTVEGVSGVAVDVDAMGALVLESDGVRRRVVAGEIAAAV